MSSVSSVWYGGMVDGMFIYLVENIVNGKRYVGKTSRSVELRWSEHVKGVGSAKGKDALHAAIAKHGVQSFNVTTIETCSSESELSQREGHWIRELGTHASLRKGYNLTWGGEGNAGYRHTDEAKRKISEANLGKVVSEETRQLFTEARKRQHAQPTPAILEARRQHGDKIRGPKNHFFGKSWGRKGPLREETKRRISESRQGMLLSAEHKEGIGAGVRAYYADNPGPNAGTCYPIACFDLSGSLVHAYRNYDHTADALGLAVKALRSKARNGDMVSGFRIVRLHKHTQQEFEKLLLEVK